MVKSLSAGTRVMASIRRFLEHELRLTVNEKKSKVAPVGDAVSSVLSLYGAKSGGVIKPSGSSSGVYASSPEGAGLFPWNTGIRS